MRRVLSSACFTLGAVWSAAGIVKLVFGVRLTLPLLPPFGLEQIAVVPSLAVGLVLFAVGAVFGRVNVLDKTAPDSTPAGANTLPPTQLPFGVQPIRPPERQPNER